MGEGVGGTMEEGAEGFKGERGQGEGAGMGMRVR